MPSARSRSALDMLASGSTTTEFIGPGAGVLHKLCVRYPPITAQISAKTPAIKSQRRVRLAVRTGADAAAAASFRRADRSRASPVRDGSNAGTLDRRRRRIDAERARQRFLHRARAGVTLGRVRRERAIDRLDERIRQIGTRIVQPPPAALMRFLQFAERGRDDRIAAGHQVIQQHAEAVEIARRAWPLPHRAVPARDTAACRPRARRGRFRLHAPAHPCRSP